MVRIVERGKPKGADRKYAATIIPAGRTHSIPHWYARAVIPIPQSVTSGGAKNATRNISTIVNDPSVGSNAPTSCTK